ncbi:MAG: acylphosphatase [Thermodesulfobacteriota bacterium]|nr:acylphosphatase [Thermodesulfobacteriota bacterium]
MTDVRAHVLVSGRVQGVLYRYKTCDVAQSLGLKGWVRNLSDGRVEAVFEGENNDVDRAIKWCQQGPPAAKVAGVEVDWETYTGEFIDFEIRY